MSPQLYLICGMAGAGKTTLAKSLEEELSAVRLCPDEWIAAVLAKPDDRSEMDRIREPIEKLQWQHAKKMLNLGIDVVLENGFWKKDERMEYRHSAKELGFRVFLHYLDVPENELVKRIVKRNENLACGTFRVEPDEIKLWLSSWFDPPHERELKLYDGYKVHVD
jgi:predicted kinase